MKSKPVELYSVVILGDKLLTDDLSDCLTVSCTNKRSLEKITGIVYDRLVYIFTRKGKNILIEGGNVIVRSSQLYKGDQQGRKEGTVLSGFNR